MSMRFKSKNRVPPGDGFQFTHPETGHISRGMRYHMWMDAIRRHREGNHLPPVAPEEAEHQNCAGLSPEARREFCEDVEDTVQTIGLSLGDMLRGTATLAAFKLSPDTVVSQPEAERRASICANYDGIGCKYNVHYRSGCGVDCQSLIDSVKAIVGDEVTSQDSKLLGCAVCTCALKAKIWLPLEALRRFESAELASKYPDWCWMKKGGVAEVLDPA